MIVGVIAVLFALACVFIFATTTAAKQEENAPTRYRICEKDGWYQSQYLDAGSWKPLGGRWSKRYGRKEDCEREIDASASLSRRLAEPPVVYDYTPKA